MVHGIAMAGRLCVVACVVAASSAFGYGRDAAAWPGTCSTGRLQSPIDIVEADNNPSLKSLLLEGPCAFSRAATTTVTPGHSIMLQDGHMECAAVDPLTLRRYRFSQLHFHQRSEHLWDGARSSMELHVVFSAADRGPGVLVVAVAVEASRRRSAPQMTRIMGAAFHEHARELAGVALGAAVAARHEPYVTYTGSLTTPPCTEGVRWVVLQNPAFVSQAVVAAFAQHMRRAQHNWTGNARPPQPLHRRAVERFEPRGMAGPDGFIDAVSQHAHAVRYVALVSLLLLVLGAIAATLYTRRDVAAQETRCESEGLEAAATTVRSYGSTSA